MVRSCHAKLLGHSISSGHSFFFAGYALDKKHTFAVNMFDDFEKYLKVPEVYQPPEPKAFQAAESIHSWMLDKLGRDQFVIRSGDMTEVFWNDGKRGRSDLVRACPLSHVNGRTQTGYPLCYPFIGLSASVLDGELCAVEPARELHYHDAQAGCCNMGRTQVGAIAAFCASQPASDRLQV